MASGQNCLYPGWANEVPPYFENFVEPAQYRPSGPVLKLYQEVQLRDWIALSLRVRLEGLETSSVQLGVMTMAVIVIADIKLINDSWVPDYAAKVHHLVHKHGGKYLARSGNVRVLEGKPLDTTLIALLQFPSIEAVEAFANDPDYAPFAAARKAGSESRFQMIDDTDIAGTIPYLAKG